MIDNRGSTPLHWACYSKSEFALNYLLSMNPNLEIKDNQGWTPLHLAIKSVEPLKSTRPVRALLMKGADRDAKDNENKSCKELVDVEDDNLRMDLLQMLEHPKYVECLMVRTPLIPLKPNHKT